MMEQLLYECKKQNITLSVENGKLVAYGRIPSRLRPLLAKHKDELIQRLGRTADRQETFRKSLLQQVAENIRESEALRVDIIKGIQAGRVEREILFMALECIGKMTNDKHFAKYTKSLLQKEGAK